MLLTRDIGCNSRVKLKQRNTRKDWWSHESNKISFFIYLHSTICYGATMTSLSWLHSPSHIPHASPPLPSSLVSDYQYKNANQILYDKSGGNVRSRMCRQEYQSAGRTRCLLPICIKIEARRKLCRNTLVTMLSLLLRDSSRLFLLFLLALKASPSNTSCIWIDPCR